MGISKNLFKNQRENLRSFAIGSEFTTIQPKSRWHNHHRSTLLTLSTTRITVWHQPLKRGDAEDLPRLNSAMNLATLGILFFWRDQGSGSLVVRPESRSWIASQDHERFLSPV